MMYTAIQRVPRIVIELICKCDIGRLRNILLTPENIAAERDVIIEETQPAAPRLTERRIPRTVLERASNPNHRYGTAVIGGCMKCAS